MSDKYDLEIIDPSKTHNWRTEIPNAVDDMDLSPYAVRLYLRLKRRAGDTGRCWENTRNLAKSCRMSTGQVTNAKRELQNAGLIEVSEERGQHGHFYGHSITIIDIWLANYQKYSNVPGERPVHLVNRPPVHLVNTSCSPEGSPSCSPGKTKEDPYIKKSPKTKEKGTAGVPPSSPAKKTFAGDVRAAAAAAHRSHPAIQAIKEVTNYYPPPELYQLIIEKIGETPDKARLWRVHMFMKLKGHNPRNYSNLLDRYETGLQYVTGDDKALLDSMTNPFELQP